MLDTEQRTSPIKVMIVEDSNVARILLESIIEQDPRLEIVASVISGEEALELLPKVKPDVISLDIHLPGINGFEVTRRIMATAPTPIVVVSADAGKEELKISMDALRAGALSVVEKPAGVTSHQHQALAARICNQLAWMSAVKVITQRLRPLHTAPEAREGKLSPPSPSTAPLPRQGDYSLLGLVASTGGPNALATILASLPPSFSLPVVVVQHITPNFVEGFVSWLNEISNLPVILAEQGTRLQPGTVYVAPAGQHLCVARHHVELMDGPPVSGQKPAGTVLFSSMARSLGAQSIAVLLTGMGDDGSQGLKEIKDAGGYTIAESESTAVVYGMPCAAAQLNAAREQLPLGSIAQRLLDLTKIAERQIETAKPTA